MVPVFTFAHESHGEFNENTHVFYAKRSMTSAKKLRKNDALDDYDLILMSVLVSPLVSKEKGQRLNTSDLYFRWWAIQDSNL